jgi:hypothetical protein
VSSWYNPDSDTCWVAVALVLASKAKTTELFWRAECVQVIYNDVARVAVWNLHASLRFARLRLRFVMVTRWHFTGYPVTKLERFRMQRLFFLIHGGCLDVLLVFCAH